LKVSDIEVTHAHSILNRGHTNKSLYHLPFEIYFLGSHWCLQSFHLLKSKKEAIKQKKNDTKDVYSNYFQSTCCWLNKGVADCSCPVKVNVGNAETHQQQAAGVL